MIIYPHIALDRSKPGLVPVNAAGRRFVDEAVSYHEFTRAMYRSHSTVPTIPAVLVCDRRFVRKYRLGMIRPLTPSLRRYVDIGYLHVGDSVADLAKKIGVDPAGLAATVAAANGVREDRRRRRIRQGEQQLRSGQRRSEARPQSLPGSDRQAAVLRGKGLPDAARHELRGANQRRRPGLESGRGPDRQPLCLWQRHAIDPGRRVPGPRHADRHRDDVRLRCRAARGRELGQRPLRRTLRSEAVARPAFLIATTRSCRRTTTSRRCRAGPSS